MIDLTKKYTISGYEVLEIKHYPENPGHKKLLAIYKIKGVISVAWFKEDGKSFTGGYNLKLVPEKMVVDIYKTKQGNYVSCFRKASEVRNSRFAKTMKNLWVHMVTFEKPEDTE